MRVFVASKLWGRECPVLMDYDCQLSRCVLLSLFIAIAGMGTPVFAGGFSPGSVTDQRFVATGTSASCEAGGLCFTSARQSHGLSRFPLAYVDPGSGQLIWQMSVAACVGSLFFIKRGWAFLRKLVGKCFKKR